MKTTGIVRKLDELGRVVLPIELRRTFDLAEKDAVEICVDGDCIILKKYQTSCVLCDEQTGLVDYKNKYICQSCIKELHDKI